VLLAGSAYSAAENAKTLQSARSVNGVNAVVVRLRIDPNLRGPLKALAVAALVAMVQAALAAHIGVNALHFSPPARDGVVTLTGVAPTMAVKQTIDQTAHNVAGVTVLVDRLVVKP